MPPNVLWVLRFQFYNYNATPNSIPPRSRGISQTDDERTAREVRTSASSQKSNICSDLWNWLIFFVHHFNGWMVYKEKQFHWKFAESKSAHYRVTVSQRKQCNKIACVYYLFCSSENVLFWLIQTHTVNNKYSPKWRLYGAKHDTKSWHPPY